MTYVKGQDRGQLTMLPDCVDDLKFLSQMDDEDNAQQSDRIYTTDRKYYAHKKK